MVAAMTAERIEAIGDSIALSSLGRDRPPKIPISRYPYTHTSGGIDFEINRVNRFNRDALRRRVLPFEEEFNYEDPFHTRGKVIHFVQNGKEVVFARTQSPDPRDIGVVTQEVKKVSVGSDRLRVLSIGIRVVLPEYQDHGIATGLAVEGMTRHLPDVVTGQTRVWGIIRMYEKTDFVRGGIPPIDEPMPILLQQALRLSLDKSILNKTDLVRGISLGAVPPAPRERFEPPANHIRANEIWERMLALGMQPWQGDVIRYGLFTDIDALYDARAKENLLLIPSPTQPMRVKFLDKLVNDLLIGPAYRLASWLPGARPKSK